MLAVATLHGDETARQALDELCKRYWQPVYAVVRSREPSSDAARDQTQSFFLHLLEKSTLRRADPARGRFRTFLLTVLWRFLRDERKKAAAEKRGGLLEECALDDVENEVSAEGSPIADLLDREWALSTMERALDAVKKEMIASRGEEIWNVLRRFLPGSAEAPAMSVAAEALNVTEAGARTEVHRLRNRCREALRKELMSTVSTPDELDDEIAYLGRILRGAAAPAG
jgi:RNA polymerase sigma-70 factor (ECF subfamily)